MDTSVVKFYSNAKAPYFVLSNLYKAPGRSLRVEWPASCGELVPPFLRGRSCEYPTREHAYQSLRAADLESAEAFMVNGCFDGWEAFRRWPAKKGETVDIYEKTVKHWGKKNMMGIVAKMAVGLDPRLCEGVFGVRIRGREHYEALDYQTEIRPIWNIIHDAFFVKGSAEAGVLLGTGKRPLAEFHRRSTADSYYSCKFGTDGVMIGQNRMGRLLQGARRRHLANILA